jgi:hypothetical protein
MVPNLIHQRRIDSRLTVMPRSARGASISRGCYHAPEIESVAEPDGVADDIGGKSVSFVCVHVPSLPISAS